MGLFTVTTTLKRNGVNVGPIDLDKFTAENIENAIMQALAIEMEFLFGEQIKNMKSQLKARRRPLIGRYSQEMSLLDAYGLAIKNSKFTIGKDASGRTMAEVKLFKSSSIDRSMKESRVGGGDGSWWKAHEYGTPSGRVLGSEDKVFVGIDIWRKFYPNLKDGELKDRFGGRHGEGIMIDHNAFPANVLGLQPHKGSKPFRIMAKMKLKLRDYMEARQDRRDKVMRTAIEILRRG